MNFFTNMLPWWGWVVLAAVPPLIVLLYFLKLRRQPLEVPSTYLWSRTIEDLHVNSIWQRLRQNLLLFLQLLLIALVMFSLLRPGWQGTELTGNRFIFLVDASASMTATDVAPTRLDAAKKRVMEMIDQMKSGDAALVISFSNTAKVEQPFTDNRRLLRERVAQITPTNRTSDLEEALRAAAGLANPGRTSQTGTNDVQVADAMPATLYIFSDGGFEEVPNFSLGNLEPVYMKFGTAEPENVAIVAFSVGRNPDLLTQQQAFARLENFSPQAKSVELSLYLDGSLIDAAQANLTAAEYKTDPASGNVQCLPGTGGVNFDLPNLEEGVLKLQLHEADALLVDNVAYATVNVPRRSRVLLVTPGNEVLRTVLGTEEAQKLAELSLAAPEVLQSKAFYDEAAAGQYDLVIFDRSSPEKMPACNTLFIGATPPVAEWTAGPVQGPPVVIDIDRAHPLMQLIEFGDVLISEGFPVKPPQGGTVLLDSQFGALLAIAPREGFEDAVLGMTILEDERTYNTDWWRKRSFPIFWRNVLEYLGGNTAAPMYASVQPGSPMMLRPRANAQRLRVVAPTGQSHDLALEGQSQIVFTVTNDLGVYQVYEGSARQPSQRFAVNLFSSRESDLHPAEKVSLGYTEVPGAVGVQRARQELWKYLLIAALGVLIFEWYVYNRRVYF